MKSSRGGTGTKGLGLALALTAGLVGCGVLTVDVYKGALVNEEEVQLHQLVALATAAKPMLVQAAGIGSDTFITCLYRRCYFLWSFVKLIVPEGSARPDFDIKGLGSLCVMIEVRAPYGFL